MFSKLIKNDQPLIIAGPCSAESQAQVMQTAKELALQHQVQIFRAGLWKPRTMPDQFEGVGAIGLPWLMEAKKATGLKMAVEVAHPQHIEHCLKAGIDCLWIGARTTVNPFMVQELAESLKGVNIPLMIKNPINPDLKLWIGAIERFLRAGSLELAAVHRGFSSFVKTKYRNFPQWEIPIELKRIYPDLPILCDPSHIAGKRSLIFEVAQQALDLHIQGLMIEVHTNPDKALSDAEQQITPATLKQFLCDLVVRTENFRDVVAEFVVEQFRNQIDRIDADMVHLLAERMSVITRIANLKKDQSVSILQINRWNEIIQNCLKHAESAGLSNDFIRQLFTLIHNEAIAKQSLIMNNNDVCLES